MHDNVEFYESPDQFSFLRLFWSITFIVINLFNANYNFELLILKGTYLAIGYDNQIDVQVVKEWTVLKVFNILISTINTFI